MIGVVVYRDEVRVGFRGVVPIVVCCGGTDTLESKFHHKFNIYSVIRTSLYEYKQIRNVCLFLPLMHGASGALHCPVDKQEINRGPSGLKPTEQTISALAPYSVVPLIETIRAFSYVSGNSSHSIGSQRGGGPSHLSSMSHVNIARPIISYPSLHR